MSILIRSSRRGYFFGTSFFLWSLYVLAGVSPVDSAEMTLDSATTLTPPTLKNTRQHTAALSVEKSNIVRALSAVDRQEYAQAFSLFETLALAGDAEAQYNLAMLYRHGKGVGKDLAMSYHWFRRAADQGMADAHIMLVIYLTVHKGLKKVCVMLMSGTVKRLSKGMVWRKLILAPFMPMGMGLSAI
jgi:TPR repeat protein